MGLIAFIITINKIANVIDAKASIIADAIIILAIAKMAEIVL